MSEYTATQTESRIAFDETDWLTQFGVLQEAVVAREEMWLSNDGLYQFKLTANHDPYADAEEIREVYDPESFSLDGRPINGGKWVIARVLGEDIKMSRQADSEGRVMNVKGLFFFIDEANQDIKVIEGDLFNNLPREPSFHDIARLSGALVDLKLFLDR